MLDRHLYKGYLLSCTPMQVEDGRYQARLSITSLGGDKTRAQRFLDLEFFDTESEAAAHAKACGMKWVDENGDAGSATTALSSRGIRAPRQSSIHEVPGGLPVRAKPPR